MELPKAKVEIVRVFSGLIKGFTTKLNTDLLTISWYQYSVP